MAIHGSTLAEFQNARPVFEGILARTNGNVTSLPWQRPTREPAHLGSHRCFHDFPINFQSAIRNEYAIVQV